MPEKIVEYNGMKGYWKDSYATIKDVPGTMQMFVVTEGKNKGMSYYFDPSQQGKPWTESPYFSKEVAHIYETGENISGFSPDVMRIVMAYGDDPEKVAKELKDKDLIPYKTESSREVVDPEKGQLTGIGEEQVHLLSQEEVDKYKKEQEQQKKAKDKPKEGEQKEKKPVLGSILKLYGE